MADTELDLMSFAKRAQDRFLAKYLKGSRHFGVITNGGLFKTFTHLRLLDAFKDEPKSRAALVAANSSLPASYIEEMTVEECVRLFELALTKFKEATPDKVFGVVTADELVRIFPATELYAFLDGTRWDEQDTDEHRALALVLLTAYIQEDLGGDATKTLVAIEEAIGFENYVKHLPPEILVLILQQARGNASFSEVALAEIVTPEILAKHLPIPVLMRPIRAAAETFGFVKKPEPVYVPPQPPPSTPSLPPGGDADDVETTPTKPPPAGTKADGDGGDPILEIGKGDGADPNPDGDDAELDALFAADAEARKAAETSGTGDPPLRLDDEDDAQTTVGAIPRPGGNPPPLPRPGQTTGRRRNS